MDWSRDERAIRVWDQNLPLRERDVHFLQTLEVRVPSRAVLGSYGNSMQMEAEGVLSIEGDGGVIS